MFKFSITTKFVICFLSIALIPLILATYISYHSSRKVLRQEVANSLIAVADNKALEVETYLREKLEKVTTLSHASDIIYAVEKFNEAHSKGGRKSEAYAEVSAEYGPFLTYYQKSAGYDELFLINPMGDIIFSTKEDAPGSAYSQGTRNNSQMVRVFIAASTSLKTEVSDFEYYPKDNVGVVFIAAPVFKGGDIIGMVIAQMGNQGVTDLIHDYNGLGKTGETAIASNIDGRKVYITPLRFDLEAAFRREIATKSQEGEDIKKAAQGKRVSSISLDYRKKEVLNVWRYLPSFRWDMLVKMDTAEVFSSAEKLRNILLRISLLLLVVVVIVAIIIANSISSPIRQLTEVSTTIAGGDLSARAAINTKDEIGILAQSFNQMTDNLLKAKANVEQKKNELEEQKKLLEKANKELDSFVYTASHDLRAPLRGISSFANFLEEDYKNKLDDEGKDYLREIREGAGRMNSLIEDLLTLSRISRIENPYENVNMRELIDSVIKRIEFDIKNNKVELIIQEKLPTIYCDRIKISEVILNLVNNAIKFSSKNKKEKPRVEIGYIDDRDSHEFFVKDNGIGIDPKYHSQVFGIFKRLHTTKEYEGTGAGLSIVKRVIDDHEGKIWIESEAGKGAVFNFTIPKHLKKEEKPERIVIGGDIAANRGSSKEQNT
ncbi:MAG: ATP-binding protein [Candidatus Omnitrophota bacterium]